MRTYEFAHLFDCDAIMWIAFHLRLFKFKQNETKRNKTNKRKTNVFLSVLCVVAMICSQLRFVGVSFDRCMCFVTWIAEGF